MPVANPEGVAPLIAVAFAASDPDEPPPRVLAMVKRPASGVQENQEPSSAALAAAIEYARARGVAIDAQSVWSDNPALHIISAARSAQVVWILLGYHRTERGGDTMGGVVREVFKMAKGISVNMGVFIQGTDLPFERIFAAVDAGPDGTAALSLGIRIARKKHCKLRAILLSNESPAISPAQPEPALVDMMHNARTMMGRLFHSDVLTQRTQGQLFRQSPGRLLIVGKKFADEIRLPLDEVPEGDRCLIVVQGAQR